MYIKVPLRVSISHLLFTALLVFLLIAYNTSHVDTSQAHRALSPSVTANTASTPPPSDPTIVPDSVSDPTAVISLNKLPVSFEVAGLHIEASRGIQCPLDYSPVPTANLVLATEQQTYTTEEVQQIMAYLKHHLGPWGEVPPPTLCWVTGGSMQPIPGTGLMGYPHNYPCGTVLELTNTGKIPVQIPRVDVRLVNNLQQNNYQYLLIDRCSVIPHLLEGDSCTPQQGGGGGGGNCIIYSANLLLGSGSTDAVFIDTPTSFYATDQFRQTDCGELTLAPGTLVILRISFSLTPDTPNNLIYTIVPELTLDTSSGRQVYALTQLASTLAFADASQFSCYKLQGTTFIIETKPEYITNASWCM